MLLYSAMLDTEYALNADAFIALVIKCIQENQYEENHIPGIDAWQSGVHNAQYGTPQLKLTIEEYGDDSQDAPPRRLPTPQHGKGGSRRPAGKRKGSGKPNMTETRYQQLRSWMRVSHIIAIRQEKLHNNVHWYSDYILNLSMRKLTIQLSREYRRGANPEEDFSTPMLVSYLEDGGYLSADCRIPMSRRPLDLDAASKEERGGFIAALRGTDELRHPIVYLPRNVAAGAAKSCDSAANSHEDGSEHGHEHGECDDYGTVVDARHLASQVKGLAHVIIGPADESACRELAQECRCDPAQDSVAAVFWPTTDGNAKPIATFSVPRHMAAAEVEAQVRTAIRRFIVQQRQASEVPAEFTWDGVNALILDRKAEEIQKIYDEAAARNQTLQVKMRTLAARADAEATSSQADADHAKQVEQLQHQLDEAQSQRDEFKRQNLAKDEKLRQLNTEKRFEHDVERDAQRQQQRETHTFQELLDEQEQQHEESEKQLKEQMEELRSRIAQLTSQNSQLKQENDQLAQQAYSGGKETLLTYGTERDLFDGEVKDYVLEAVDVALRALPPDKNERFRKAEVLSDVLEANGYRKLHEQRRAKLKSLVPLFNAPSAELFSELEKLGFQVIRADNHYVIEYGGDARYRSTMAKTPSDKRSGENEAASLCQYTQ